MGRALSSFGNLANLLYENQVTKPAVQAQTAQTQAQTELIKQQQQIQELQRQTFQRQALAAGQSHDDASINAEVNGEPTPTSTPSTGTPSTGTPPTGTAPPTGTPPTGTAPLGTGAGKVRTDAMRGRWQPGTSTPNVSPAIPTPTTPPVTGEAGAGAAVPKPGSASSSEIPGVIPARQEGASPLYGQNQAGSSTQGAQSDTLTGASAPFFNASGLTGNSSADILARGITDQLARGDIRIPPTTLNDYLNRIGMIGGRTPSQAPGTMFGAPPMQPPPDNSGALPPLDLSKLSTDILPPPAVTPTGAGVSPKAATATPPVTSVNIPPKPTASMTPPPTPTTAGVETAGSSASTVALPPVPTVTPASASPQEPFDMAKERMTPFDSLPIKAQNALLKTWHQPYKEAGLGVTDQELIGNYQQKQLEAMPNMLASGEFVRMGINEKGNPILMRRDMYEKFMKGDGSAGDWGYVGVPNSQGGVDWKESKTFLAPKDKQEVQENILKIDQTLGMAGKGYTALQTNPWLVGEVGGNINVLRNVKAAAGQLTGNQNWENAKVGQDQLKQIQSQDFLDRLKQLNMRASDPTVSALVSARPEPSSPKQNWDDWFMQINTALQGLRATYMGELLPGGGYQTPQFDLGGAHLPVTAPGGASSAINKAPGTYTEDTALKLAPGTWFQWADGRGWSRRQ